MEIRKSERILIILILLICRCHSFSQNIPIREMNSANTVAIANGAQNSVNVQLSSDKSSWHGVELGPFSKKIYKTPMLYVNVKTNGVEEKYALKKSIDSIYVIYWDPNFSRYKIARRKIK